VLVGYVSDERYVAIADCQLLFENDATAVEARSAANGAVYAELAPGDYEVSLNRDGFGPKRVQMSVSADAPHQFRLLSQSLLGYAWPRCVRSGEKAEFRVHAHEAYKISLWRYGYEKELAKKIGWFDEHGPGATVQITPDGDYTQTGAQWNKFGYTSPHHKQYVAAPERSGLYYFHAQGESGEFFSFPWVVAPAKPTAKVAILAADMTWNAYNNFGGRSNYIHPDVLPPTPTLNARLELKRYTDPEHINHNGKDYDPLSFDRPEPINHIPEQVHVTDPIEGRAACHIAPAEWRFLGWMEREGFAYDYYSETQLHFDVLNLDEYKLLIITTHPEYWSADMYYKVKKWVFERGGRLMYLGGNGLNCDVEFLDEQTCIYRNEDCRELRDASKGFESRFHQREESEANLLGVVFDERGIMTAAPYEVVDDTHWVFQGTGLKNGDQFGTESQHERVPGGASGHETDKRSKSSPENTLLLAQGLNADGGGAEMVIHEPGEGGAVFSAGSINWPSSVLVDEGVSQITANVVRRFTE
jgi:N,N-dimethylformamidase